MTTTKNDNKRIGLIQMSCAPDTAAILDPRSTAKDNIFGIYRKMHIPDDPLYYEKFYFTPGDLGFKAFDTKFG